MTTTCRHWAICLETGEVLGSTTGNALKRHIARNTAWDIANGYGGKRSWRFHHGDYEGLRMKFFSEPALYALSDEEYDEYWDESDESGFNPYMGCYDFDC